jgi:hypothetical protein
MLTLHYAFASCVNGTREARQDRHSRIWITVNSGEETRRRSLRIETLRYKHTCAWIIFHLSRTFYHGDISPTLNRWFILPRSFKWFTRNTTSLPFTRPVDQPHSSSFAILPSCPLLSSRFAHAILQKLIPKMYTFISGKDVIYGLFCWKKKKKTENRFGY